MYAVYAKINLSVNSFFIRAVLPISFRIFILRVRGDVYACFSFLIIDSRGQRAKRARWQRTDGSLIHLATAARVKYPAALQSCKFNTPYACSGVFDCCLTEKTAGKPAVFSAYRYLCCLTGCPCHKFLPKRGERGYAWKRIPAEEASAHREGS